MGIHNDLTIVCFKNTSDQISKAKNIHIIKMSNRIINENCSKIDVICGQCPAKKGAERHCILHY